MASLREGDTVQVGLKEKTSPKLEIFEKQPDYVWHSGSCFTVNTGTNKKTILKRRIKSHLACKESIINRKFLNG